MPALKTYSVFICHDWEYRDDYSRICQFLESAPNFKWEPLIFDPTLPLSGPAPPSVA